MRLLFHNLLERVVVVVVVVVGGGGGGSFEIGRPSSKGWNDFDVDGQDKGGEGGWGLEN